MRVHLTAAALAAMATIAAAQESGVVLTHPSGYVKLGVRSGGGLTYLPPEGERVYSSDDIGIVGLRFVDMDNIFQQGENTEFESISPGLRLEGWGAAYQMLEDSELGTDPDEDTTSPEPSAVRSGRRSSPKPSEVRAPTSLKLSEIMVSGHSNEEKGDVNIAGGALQLGPGCGADESTCSEASSTVMLGECLEVRHFFMPAKDCMFAFQVEVEIENVCDTPIGRVLYRRNMDWDVEMSPFENYVTLAPGDARDLMCLNLDGTCSGDPTAERCDATPEREACAPKNEITTAGPSDLGSTFTFEFSNITPEDPLAPGEQRSLTAFYGAAPTIAGAVEALAKLDAEAYSLAAPVAPELGAAHFFGFAGISGNPVPPLPPPELPVYSCDCEVAIATTDGRSTGIVFGDTGGCGF